MDGIYPYKKHTLKGIQCRQQPATIAFSTPRDFSGKTMHEVLPLVKF
jgi:hypothetical protein